LAHAIEHLGAEVFDIGNDQRRALSRRAQNLLGHLEELPGGLGDRVSAAGVSQTNRLAAFGVKKEETLGLLGGWLAGSRAALDHVALGVADLAVGVQSQQLARQVSAGPPQLPQTNLKLVGLLDGVGVEQVMNGAVAGKKRQAIGQFETLVTQ